MKDAKICSICGAYYSGFGNNAEPINNGRCCDDCNEMVILRRITEICRIQKKEAKRLKTLKHSK